MIMVPMTIIMNILPINRLSVGVITGFKNLAVPTIITTSNISLIMLKKEDSNDSYGRIMMMYMSITMLHKLADIISKLGFVSSITNIEAYKALLK